MQATGATHTHTHRASKNRRRRTKSPLYGRVYTWARLLHLVRSTPVLFSVHTSPIGVSYLAPRGMMRRGPVYKYSRYARERKTSNCWPGLRFVRGEKRSQTAQRESPKAAGDKEERRRAGRRGGKHG